MSPIVLSALSGFTDCEFHQELACLSLRALYRTLRGVEGTSWVNTPKINRTLVHRLLKSANAGKQRDPTVRVPSSLVATCGALTWPLVQPSPALKGRLPSISQTSN